MDDPQKDVERVIRRLTQSPPWVQRATIEKYFTPDAAFIHPFCRTGSFDGSRLLIRAIYRWYKIMSPKIQLDVNSIAYDPKNLILYVTMHQLFKIWIIPFHSSSVNLTTVLRLRQDKFDGKYYIQSQNDLYQTDEFVRFFWMGGHIVIWLFQLFATFQCVLAAWIFSPLGKLEQREVNGVSKKDELSYENFEGEGPFIETSKGSGSLVTAPAYEQR